MGTQRPNHSNRWAVFALLLVGIALFILTQPYQRQSILFVLLIPLSLVLGVALMYSQRTSISAFSAAGDAVPAEGVTGSVAITVSRKGYCDRRGQLPAGDYTCGLVTGP